jgi:ubiquinone/menaquinone biosynthesis C-methylase UbiE
MAAVNSSFTTAGTRRRLPVVSSALFQTFNPTPATTLDNRQFFNLGTRGYEFITNQPLWRRQITRVLEHVDDPTAIDSVLDLGCGWGVSSFVLAEALPAARVIGIDIADKMIARAHHHHRHHFSNLGNVSFEIGDASGLRFDDDQFDLAVGHSFLYLVDERLTVLEEIRRVLKPGGRLVLMEPYRRGNLWEAATRPRTEASNGPEQWGDWSRFAVSMVLWRIVSSGRGQWESEEIEALFRQAGFDRVETRPTLGGLGLHCIGCK